MQRETCVHVQAREDLAASDSIRCTGDPDCVEHLGKSAIAPAEVGDSQRLHGL